jgi:hypothetical protein
MLKYVPIVSHVGRSHISITFVMCYLDRAVHNGRICFGLAVITKFRDQLSQYLMKFEVLNAMKKSTLVFRFVTSFKAVSRLNTDVSEARFLET